MGANKNSNIQKCGEILINIKSKNRKSKTYIFQCTFCNIGCDQLKKFSIHLEEKHLNKNFKNNLEEAEVKFVTEDEFKNEPKSEDEKNEEFENDSYCRNQAINADPLGAITPEIEIVKEDVESGCDVNEAKCDLEKINPIKSQDEGGKNILEEKYNDEFELSTGGVEDEKSLDYSSEEHIEEKLVNEIKRKYNTTIKRGKRLKLKQSTSSPVGSEDSNNEDQNVEKGINTVKKHKRCKKRWKNIDDTKLPVLIKIYRKYEVLWEVNDIAFGILPKRNETFGKMIDELKSDHNFDKNLDELQDHIDYLNYLFYKDREQELKCEIENKDFIPSSKYYRELSFLGDSQGPFKCSNCNEIIAKYDRYHIHVAQHNGTVPFQCRLCEMGFQKFDNYLRHVTRHLGINSYHCKVCGKGYPFKSELDWHMTSHTGVKPYLCPICGAGFRARHGYDNHIRRHEKRFRYECHICKHGFNHLCKLNTHIKSHLNIRDVICNVCGKGFTAAKYLQRHKLIHEEEKRYKCNVCGKAFAQDSGMRTHKKQHQPYATVAENKNLLSVSK